MRASNVAFYVQVNHFADVFTGRFSDNLANREVPQVVVFDLTIKRARPTCGNITQPVYELPDKTIAHHVRVGVQMVCLAGCGSVSLSHVCWNKECAPKIGGG